MRVIIHDLNDQNFQEIYPQNTSKDEKIISKSDKIKNCIGCFGCWVKTPGFCVIKDGFENIGEIFSKADEIIVISECCYGTYSPFVKNVLDRSIPYLLPFFRIRNNEVHHTMRNKNRFSFKVFFYGKNIGEDEIKIAESLIKANSYNLNYTDYSLSFNDFSNLTQN